MMQIGFIGLGAGVASALLFASVASGSLLSIFLFYLAPLPIMIAAIGWNYWAGAIATLVAALGLAGSLGSVFLFAYLVGTGAPAWWLGYLAMLARPAVNGGAGTLEWYPPGRLVLCGHSHVPRAVGLPDGRLVVNPGSVGLQAFDDGTRVFIQMPAAMSATEAPALFVLTSEGDQALVNYRLRGRYFVVDKLFAEAILMLGVGGKQESVSVIRLSREARR